MRPITLSGERFYVTQSTDEPAIDLAPIGLSAFRLVYSGVLTKYVLARMLNLPAYDTALPQQWVDEQERRERGWTNRRPAFNTGSWVWVYPAGSLFGEPLNLIDRFLNDFGPDILDQLTSDPDEIEF